MKKIIVFLTVLVVWTSCKNIEKKESVKQEKTVVNRVLPKLEDNRYNVAFLIMDGTFNTEFTAPFDIFQHTQYRDGIKAMNVFTVANTLNPITTFEGVRILPDYDYTKDDLPLIDILVIPSAEHHLDSDLQDTTLLNFVRKVSEHAMFVTSHCDGAFVLAKSGILDGYASTTFPSDIDKYKSMFPHLDVRKDVIFVHDGKFITSAGGARSFDAALYLCEFIYGSEIARSLSGGLVIDWDLSKVPHTVIKR